MADDPEPQQFVEALAPAVRHAAVLARALEGRVQNEPKRGEESDVKAAMTHADAAAQEAILVPLLEAFPQVALQAEEDTPSVASFPESSAWRVVVDPIDGTLRSYLEHRGPYGCMVGLAFDDAYQAALVALPREGLFFTGTRGGGAERTRPRGLPRPARSVADGASVLVSFDFPTRGLAILEAAGFRPVPACGGAVSIAPLLPGVRAGVRYVGPGKSISIRGRIGLLVAREAGASVIDAAGEPFPEDIETPRETLGVAADPADLDVLEQALSAASLAER